MVNIRKGASFVFHALGLGKVRNAAKCFISRMYLRKNARKITGCGIIRVAFIVYEPSMWDKQAPVYNEMQKRKDIEPCLIVIPDQGGTEEERKQKKTFFFQRYNNVLELDSDVLTKFKHGTFQYTFYQTPYLSKCPKELQPLKLVRYTKICYIPYGYVGSSAFFETTTDVGFFSNVYFGFMDNKQMQGLLLKKFQKESNGGYQHFLSLGYPSFESYLEMSDNNGRINNILWLPRWSYAEEGGGSHFMEYKDSFISMAEKHRNLKCTLRPHPLMFSAFIKQGIISEESLAQYKENLAENSIVLDECSLLDDTLRETDIMIADYSSVLIMYILSGRPIIYCDGGLSFDGIYTQLKDAMYFAHNWSDVEEIVEKLLNGDDPLKEKREELISSLGDEHRNASCRIVDRIVSDYRVGRKEKPKDR